jgi:anti-sigma-K factor RskA
MSDLHKLSGAYALDALDDLERARFEQHLATCEDCRAEVAELRETAALLAETTATPPPAPLRDSVLSGISQVRPLPPEAPATSRSRTRRSDRGGWWVPLMVAAALALLVGIGSTLVRSTSDDEPPVTTAERVMQADDAQEVFLDLGEAGRATVIRSVSEDRAVIVTEDMVSAPEGKAYELWIQTPDEEMVPAGMMPDEPDQTLVLEGAAGDALAVGITVEPEGGSEKPTSEPIALFDFSEAT